MIENMKQQIAIDAKRVAEFAQWEQKLPVMQQGLVLKIQAVFINQLMAAKFSGADFNTFRKRCPTLAQAVLINSIDRLAEMGIEPGSTLAEMTVVEMTADGQTKSTITVDDPFKENSYGN